MSLLYISQTELQALDKYKYAAEDHSLLKKLFLGAFWEWSVGLFPMWVAPNLITFIGFLCLLSNCILAFYFCPSTTGCNGVPNWLFMWTAVNLFIYQTLDNVDGKQARRTGSSSPLGELFDHGCDSLFMLFTGFPFYLAMGLDNWYCFYFLTIAVAVFFFTHWEEYHTGKLVMGLLANPTEVQFCLMVVFSVAFFKSPSFFLLPFKFQLPQIVVDAVLPYDQYDWLSAPTNKVIFWFTFAAIASTFSGLVVSTWEACKQRSEAFSAAIARGMPQIIAIVAMFIWATYSKYDVLNKQTVYFLSLHAMIFSYLCDQILLARICDQKFPWYNWINIFPVAGALNALFREPLIPEVYALPAIFSVFFVIYIYFVVSVIWQFKTFLKIDVFRIKSKAY